MMGRYQAYAMLFVGAGLPAFGCGSLSDERAHVLAMASDHLDCRGEPLHPRVDDEGASVRHWNATCAHRSVRITCDDRGCNQDVEHPKILCDLPPLRGGEQMKVGNQGAGLESRNRGGPTRGARVTT